MIGGCYQLGSWESQPDPSMAVRIMARAVELCPSLTTPGNGGVPGKTGIEALSIIRHGVGLRPTRAAGPRVEFEMIQGLPVVHSYGHGGGTLFFNVTEIRSNLLRNSGISKLMGKLQ